MSEPPTRFVPTGTLSRRRLYSIYVDMPFDSVYPKLSTVLTPETIVKLLRVMYVAGPPLTLYMSHTPLVPPPFVHCAPKLTVLSSMRSSCVLVGTDPTTMPAHSPAPRGLKEMPLRRM